MTGSGELRDGIITNMTTMFQRQLLDKKKLQALWTMQFRESCQNIIMNKLIATAEV